MGFIDIVPLAVPAVAVIGSAIWITLREVRGRDVVVDLADGAVPQVRLSGVPPRTDPLPPRSGDLVPAPGASLGARLQRTEPSRPGHGDPPRRSVKTRRRTRPLVADRS